MKKTAILATFAFFFLFQFQTAYPQGRDTKHKIKIVGKTEVPLISGSPGQQNVSYDDNSPDHLIVTSTDQDGHVLLKTRYSYSDQKFDLSLFQEYTSTKKLLPDGLQTTYRSDGTTEFECVFAAGILQQKTSYYPNGYRQSLISGDDTMLKGEYKIWHENGQLCFSGNYRNNLKDGKFQSFDKSGIEIKQGMYEEGKLISGEPVVLDVLYENPEKPAEFINGEEAFDEYLRKKSTSLDGLNEIYVAKKIKLGFTIDPSGKIKKIEIPNGLLPHELSLINRFFEELPGFKPALEENVPVSSLYKLNLTLSNQGLKREVPDNVVTVSEEMPHFPGGVDALRSYLSKSIRYPHEAQRNHLQGKVFVSFIVDEDGNISNVKLAQGVHSLLDEEAIRVVRNMPQWFPGKQDGKFVKVRYIMPINFSLR